MKTNGFTLVEIMIVVAIIGILAAIAIPNFMRSRKMSHMTSCIANLKQIDGAKMQASFAHTDVNNATVLFGVSAFIKVTPVCPLNKLMYTIGALNEPPGCPNMAADTAYPHTLPLLEL